MSTESQTEPVKPVAVSDDMGVDAVGEPAAVTAAPALTTLTPELIALLQMVMKQSSNDTLDAIREMKRLSPEDQKKKDDEAARSMALTLRRVESAKREESKFAQAWQSCSHRQPNGKTRFRGQGLSNGYTQAFCQECHYLSPPFKLTLNEIQGGVNLDQWTGDVFAVIQQRVRQSEPPPPVEDIPPGARILF